MSQGHMPVMAACFNQTYVPHVATMLRSFADSAVGPSRWYLIGDGSVDSAVLRQLLDFARRYRVDAESLVIPEHLILPFGDRGRYPRIAWCRAVLAELLADEDRVIYLDSDTIVLHDLRALWEADLTTGHFFGAVGHPSYAAGNDECDRLRLPHGSLLLNSGVMVMDLALMRSDGFAARIRGFVTSPNCPELRYADQDAMNALFAGRWTPLDPVYNCLSSILLPFVGGTKWRDDIHYGVLALERAALSPTIVHFDGSPVLRPWNQRCFNPFASLYLKYRATTPWPLKELEGRRQDAVLRHIPPRLQAKVWHLRRLQARLPSRESLHPQVTSPDRLPPPPT